MEDWSLTSEYFSLILLVVIALFMHGNESVHKFHRRYFVYIGSLTLSGISILLNIAAVNVISNISGHSIIFAVVLNTAYFLVSWLMVTVMVYYLFLRLFEFIYDNIYILRTRIMLTVIYFIFVLLLVYNFFSGVIFYFDEAGEYCRGPLNFIGYLLPIIDVTLLLVSYIRHRKTVGLATEKVLFVAAPIALLLMIYQMQYPDYLLNGAISAIVNLIIFISYRGERDDRDFQTGLESRHSFATEIMQRTDERSHYQIILVKVRYLSRIVRVYGQSGYNTILFQLGDMFRKLAAGKGMAFRYSEERFALIFDGAETNLCDERLDMITERMERRFKLGKYETVLKFSAIDFRYNGQEWSEEDINSYLTNALHIAMTEDTEKLPFTEEIFFHHQLREYILKSMHTALDDGRFKILYQPVYYHHSGKFESAEALLRMNDEDGKPISPSDFIPIAEETGFLDELLEFLLENVCRLLASGKIKDLNAISINLPIREFLRSDLKVRFRVILQKYNIKPKQVKLEITERDIDETGCNAINMINDLAADGYCFMLDDFGVAYSNLSRVLTIPFETVKIDRSIVLLMGEHENYRSIMREHVVPLFRELGQNVLAEGVETSEMVDFVLESGIDRIQGYYYAKPMTEADLIEWYKAH